MNSSTPPKHRTPNYKLVRRSYTSKDWSGRLRTFFLDCWEAQPLRATRKDLHTT